MIDCEKLIENVRPQSILYDTADEDYKNKSLKEQIWLDIADTMGNSIDDLKKKWKNLKDSYSKYIRCETIKTRYELKILGRYKSWPWASHMEFLRPFIKFTERSSYVKTSQSIHDNMNENTGDTAIKDEVEEFDIFKQPPQQSHEDNPLSDKELAPTSTTAIGKRRLQEPTSSSTTVQHYFKRQKIDRSSEHEDIDLILMGYAKIIKNFSATRQAMVKFRFAQIVMEEELAQLAENEENHRDVPDFSASSSSSNEPSVVVPVKIQINPSTSWYEAFGPPEDDSFDGD